MGRERVSFRSKKMNVAFASSHASKKVPDTHALLFRACFESLTLPGIHSSPCSITVIMASSTSSAKNICTATAMSLPLGGVIGTSRIVNEW